jgi:GrpB-like predicted nucleotidyltransferase (UPF0157 family)
MLNTNNYSKLNRPILVVDYNPRWLVLFKQEKERLIAALGRGLTLVEHIGSAAVPGMAAKPVIDIAVGILNLAEFRADIACIERLGYIYKPTLEQTLPERLFFWKGTPTVHAYHLHVAEVGHPMLLRPISFRDYLRKHPDTAWEYGKLKKELAKNLWVGSGCLCGWVVVERIEQVLRKEEDEDTEPGAA